MEPGVPALDASGTPGGRAPDRAGTSSMVAGVAAAAISAYVFQVMGGRVLGSAGFAPISIMWTAQYLGYTVLFLPVEQLIIRRITLGGAGRGALRSVAGPALAVSVGGAVAAGAFGFFTRDRFFEGASVYAVILLLLFLSYGLYAVGRGVLGGRRRFRAYGAAVAGEAVLRIAAAAIALWGLRTAEALAWSMVVAPLAVLLVRPFRREGVATPDSASQAAVASFLGWYLVATAASQAILAGGPILVGVLGATPAALSVFFVTFTLFRGPISSSYHLLARVLPRFTEMAARGDQHTLGVWAVRLGSAGLLVSVAGGAAGAAFGPAIVALLFGNEFRPTALLAGLAAAGMLAGIVVLFVSQIVIGRGATSVLALVWVGALLVAAFVALAARLEPSLRTGVAFVAGESAALVGMMAAVLWGRPRPVSRNRVISPISTA